MTQAREMTSDTFAHFMNDLTNRQIRDLLNSQAINEKIGGIMAIRTFAFALLALSLVGREEGGRGRREQTKKSFLPSLLALTNQHSHTRQAHRH